MQQSRRSLNTISPEEISHFSSLSQTWWNEKGDFNVLQRMNKVRVEFLRERLRMVKRYEDGSTLQDLKSIDGPFPLKGMKVLDVGCGGGLFTEVGVYRVQSMKSKGFELTVYSHRDSQD
jgi:polyprenyldihydroxybenzoate methyltransferase/3-demethylubiquinol 3-O-methyltransferase